MPLPTNKRLARSLKFLGFLAIVIGVAAGGVAGWFYRQLRQSLPTVDGEAPLAGLRAPVQIGRDALGVPTLTGATRADVARALGYVHAQDRFFQMDLLRRSAAGELAEIFGRAALRADSAVRIHGFRAVAGEVVARATPVERAVVEAYTAGVNAGLASLRAKPWEYLVLRAEPAPWREEDTALVVFAMWLDLQNFARLERSRGALQKALGSDALAFFCPPGGSWDAALDGSTFPAEPLPPPDPFPAPASRLGESGGATAFPSSDDGTALIAGGDLGGSPLASLRQGSGLARPASAAAPKPEGRRRERGGQRPGCVAAIVTQFKASRRTNCLT